MPTLDWIGKRAVLNHHREVPVHLLEEDPALSVGDPDSGNLLVQGDNLLALKALLPRYAGQVKCIYIDPPYNTGNEGWVYNDAVNSPEVRDWLGKVVGAEAEDLSRHDKWLCMMYPRLHLLRQLLADDGVIFISIGEDEVGRLRLLCDEVLGAGNHIDTFIWQVEGNVENQEAITATHEYVLAYERVQGHTVIRTTLDPNVEDGSKLLRDFAENSVVKNGPANPASIITLPIGFPCAVAELQLPRHDFADKFIAKVGESDGYIRREFRAEFGAEYPVRLDDMRVEEGMLVAPCRVYSGWSAARKLGRFVETGCQRLLESDGTTLHFFISPTGVPTYRREGRQGHFVSTILRNLGTTERASNELERMGVRFPYPKPVGLIEYLVSLYAGPQDIVMDAFAGSGTTGHAVLKLNAERQLGLTFILVELDPEVAGQVTVPRLRGAALGYEARRGRRVVKVDGLGGGFTCARLGHPLVDSAGAIGQGVRREDLARHVFIRETGRSLPTELDGSPLLGHNKDEAVYLLWGPSNGDTRHPEDSLLTLEALRAMPPHDGPRVVYAEGCQIGPARLAEERVTFRQLPYALTPR